MVIISTFTAPVEGLKHQQPCIRVVFNDKDIGKGSLYINEHVLAWQNDTDSQIGFSIEYPHISLHALSRDPASFPHPCIYIMLDGHAELPGLGNESNGAAEQHDESDSDEENTIEITEIRLIPDEVESLETIFNAIRVCQELNPDPQDSVSEEEEYFDGEYYGAEGDTYDDNMEPDTDQMNALNLNGSDGRGDAPAFEDAD